MSGMAKYMEIYIDIRDKINQNKYEINEKLPDGDSLARVYDCSKLTVKKRWICSCKKVWLLDDAALVLS